MLFLLLFVRRVSLASFCVTGWCTLCIYTTCILYWLQCDRMVCKVRNTIGIAEMQVFFQTGCPSRHGSNERDVFPSLCVTLNTLWSVPVHVAYYCYFYWWLKIHCNMLFPVITEHQMNTATYNTKCITVLKPINASSTFLTVIAHHISLLCHSWLCLQYFNSGEGEVPLPSGKYKL